MPLHAHAQVKKSSLTEVVNGVEFYIHFVKSGQSWQDVTQTYLISEKEVKSYNKHIHGELKANMIVKIPVDVQGEPVEDFSDMVVEVKTETVAVSQVKSNDLSATSGIHIVQPKETLYFISKLYNTSVDHLKELNSGLTTAINVGQQIRIRDEVKADPVVAENVLAVEPKPEEKANHTVAEGETLYSLSHKYDISIDEIKKYNPQLKEGLKLGQALYIPEKVYPEFTKIESASNLKDTVHTFIYHRVRKKETMFSLSKKYDVTMGDIYLNNPFLKSEGLETGMRVRIPVVLDVEKQIYQVVIDRKVRDSALFIYEFIVDKRRMYADEVAERFGISEDEILNINPWIKSRLKRRQVVDIPFAIIPDKVEEVEVVEDVAEPVEEVYTGPCSNEDTERVFNVALMVPLFAGSIHELDTNMLAMEGKAFKGFNFIQFYEGALIAADSLQQLGMNLKLHVFDVDNNPEKATALLGPELQQMDLIIGPVYNSAFNIIADYASRYGIKVVNPLSQRESIVDNFNNVFKVKVPDMASMELLARHIALNKIHDSTNIVILRHNKYQNRDRSIFLLNRIQELTEQNVFIDTSVYLEDDFDGFMDKTFPWNENLVINVSDDQVFVVDVMRQMHEFCDSIPYVLYGMPSWSGFNFESQYLLDLKVHVYEDEYIDYESETVKYFLWKFRKQFGTEALASRYAFAGYDITLYFLNALYRLGPDFENCLQYNTIQTLETRFDFRKKESGSFENQRAVGYKYEDYKKVRIQ